MPTGKEDYEANPIYYIIQKHHQLGDMLDPRYVLGLYAESYKVLLREITEDPNK